MFPAEVTIHWILKGMQTKHTFISICYSFTQNLAHTNCVQNILVNSNATGISPKHIFCTQHLIVKWHFSVPFTLAAVINRTARDVSTADPFVSLNFKSLLTVSWLEGGHHLRHILYWQACLQLLNLLLYLTSFPCFYNTRFIKITSYLGFVYTSCFCFITTIGKILPSFYAPKNCRLVMS